jgi:branched-subunit amino acid transport protein
MTIVLVSLLVVAAVSWVFRISFTALFTGDRLPAALRQRMDAVGPAAFAALVVTHVAGTSTAALAPVLVALVAAGLVARRTGSHLAAVVVAAGAWWLVSLL